MTNWVDWIRWGGTLAVAVGALVLGIRAEHRAARYKATFVINGNRHGSATIANTTGEPAADVVVTHWGVGGQAFFESALMLEDEVASFPVDFSLGIGALEVMHVQWTRPISGQRYEQLGPVIDTRIRPLSLAREAFREGLLRRTSKGRRRRF